MKKMLFLFLFCTLAACGGGSHAEGTNPSPDSLPGSAPGSPTRQHSLHRRCGWIEGNNTAGEESFVQHASWFDAIHPAWWKLTADGGSVVPMDHLDQPNVMQAARSAGVELMPL